MMKQGLKGNPNATTIPDIIELGKGLNFTKPKLTAGVGTLLDCLNYEVVDSGGLGRIAGCEPYDGEAISVVGIPGTYRRLQARGGSGFAPTLGTLLVQDGTDNVFGVVITHEQSGLNPPFFHTVYYCLVNEDYEPGLNEFLEVYGGGTSVEIQSSGGVPRDATAQEIIDESLESLMSPRDGVNAYAEGLRNEVTAMQNTPIGLHWFRDRLYAVCDDIAIRFSNLTGTGDLTPGMYIGTDDGTNLRGRVLAVEEEGETLAGWVWIQNLNAATNWVTNANNVQSPVNTYTDSDFDTILTEDVFDTSVITGSPTDSYAFLWQSRSSEQATAESATAGWSRIDSGFEVAYEQGFAESGELVKIEKGTTPNYTPGGPTTTSATTANLLVQAPTVTGDIAQVQGWKSTADETVYATSADAVSGDNNTYLYGDVLAYGWGLNTSGNVKTQQPSGGVGAETSFGLTAWPPTGETLAYTTPSSYSTTIKGSNGYTYFLLNGFDGLTSAVPAGARIVGVTASVKYSAAVLFKGWPFSDAEIFSGFTNVRLESQLMTYDAGTDTATKLGSPKNGTLDFTLANFTENNDQTSGSERKVRWTKTAESTLTYGGASDLWGLSTLTRSSATDPGFTLGFRCTVDCGNTGTVGNSNDNILVYRPLIDQITVTVTYVTDSVRYYFTDGTDVIRGDLVYYNTVEGTFQAGDAEGTMQLVDVQRVSGAGNQYNIRSGMTIHTADPGTSGNQVGVVASDMVYNGLPGLDAILDESSRYQFITANFYARDDLDGFYGVSGAGKAFSVNTYTDESDDPVEYLVKITTNPLDEEGDKPRHVAFHHYALALGFSWGGVRLSVPGEPENFNGAQGAAEVGVGDPVTGLLPMKGMTLGVFCENSIWGIAGTDDQNYTTNVLAPKTGAIEYTVVDMGIPMYCDSRGISTIEQSAAYGNFAGERLSQEVTPWILPRMLRNTDADSTETSIGVACAIPVRAKNQYRVFFRDGKVLCMTINPGAPPALTFSTYYIGMEDTSDTGKYLVPLAYSSEADQTGAERIHVSHYSPTSEISASDALFVYELETGWGFAGKFIPAFFATNWHTRTPFADTTVGNLRMEGLTLGYGSSVTTVAKDYNPVYNTTQEPISLPSTPATSIAEDFYPSSHMGHVGRTGRCLSFKIEDVIPTGDTIDDPIPPVIFQIMLPQYASSGKMDS